LQDDVRFVSYGAPPLRSCGCHFLTLFSPLSGSPEALRSILHANAHRAYLYAISRFGPAESPTTKAAFAQALRPIAAACAELVGPSQWGLRDDLSPVREDAKHALEHFFQVSILKP
jgi:hypothetical protein